MVGPEGKALAAGDLSPSGGGGGSGEVAAIKVTSNQKNPFLKSPTCVGFWGFNWVLGFIGFFGCTVPAAVK